MFTKVLVFRGRRFPGLFRAMRLCVLFLAVLALSAIVTSMAAWGITYGTSYSHPGLSNCPGMAVARERHCRLPVPSRVTRVTGGGGTHQPAFPLGQTGGGLARATHFARPCAGVTTMAAHFTGLAQGSFAGFRSFVTDFTSAAPSAPVYRYKLWQIKNHPSCVKNGNLPRQGFIPVSQVHHFEIGKVAQQTHRMKIQKSQSPVDK